MIAHYNLIAEHLVEGHHSTRKNSAGSEECLSTWLLLPDSCGIQSEAENKIKKSGIMLKVASRFFSYNKVGREPKVTKFRFRHLCQIFRSVARWAAKFNAALYYSV